MPPPGWHWAYKELRDLAGIASKLHSDKTFQRVTKKLHIWQNGDNGQAAPSDRWIGHSGGRGKQAGIYELKAKPGLHSELRAVRDTQSDCLIKKKEMGGG